MAAPEDEDVTIANLTSDEAVDLCRAEEITVKRSQQLRIVVPDSEVNKVWNNTSSVDKNMPNRKGVSFAETYLPKDRKPKDNHQNGSQTIDQRVQQAAFVSTKTRQAGSGS